MTHLPMEISVAEIVAALNDADDSNSLILLDCRNDEEVAAGTIESPIHIPVQELQERIDELAGHRDKRIIVYCHHGRRSLMATQILRQHGFDQSQSMAGGIDQWSIEIDPSIVRY